MQWADKMDTKRQNLPKTGDRRPIAPGHEISLESKEDDNPNFFIHHHSISQKLWIIYPSPTPPPSLIQNQLYISLGKKKEKRTT